MNGVDREKYIRNDSEFRGWVLAKLENIEKEIINHKKDEMEKLVDINIRLGGLENWKVKVSGIAAGVGAVMGFIINKLF